MDETKLHDEELKKCLNCKEPLYPKALYCAYCGQKDSDGRITIRQFISEFFESVFDINSKFFKTLKHLFAPARLTREYFRGRHKQYAHPLRVFFLIAVVHLSIIAIVALSNIDNMDDTPINRIRESQSGVEVFELVEEYSEQEQQSGQSNQEILKSLDSLKRYIRSRHRVEVDSNSSMTVASFNRDSMKFTQHNIRFVDMATLPLDSIYEKYEVYDFISKVMIQQSIKANEQPKEMLRFAIGNMVWMLFVLMPILAGLMKLLFIRRQYFFIEHLVFLYHWHAFAFIVVSVYLLFAKIIPPAYIPVVFAIILGFGLMAMKRYYLQGFFKTFIKYLILLIFYLFLLLAMVVLTILISLMVF